MSERHNHAPAPEAWRGARWAILLSLPLWALVALAIGTAIA